MKNQIMLVLRIVQCLQNRKTIGKVMFQNIFYVLQHEGIDLGLEFISGPHGIYSKKLKVITDELLDLGYIEEITSGRMKIIRVTDKFNCDDYEFTEEEKQITNKVFKLYKELNTTSEYEIASILFGEFPKQDYERYSDEKSYTIKTRLIELMHNMGFDVYPF